MATGVETEEGLVPKIPSRTHLPDITSFHRHGFLQAPALPQGCSLGPAINTGTSWGHLGSEPLQEVIRWCHWVAPLESAHQSKVLQVLLASNKELPSQTSNGAEKFIGEKGVGDPGWKKPALQSKFGPNIQKRGKSKHDSHPASEKRGTSYCAAGCGFHGCAVFVCRAHLEGACVKFHARGPGIL